MASLNDIETKVHHIIDILDARTIKTITGVLPLTFTTTEDKLRDWEIRGNDDNGTENLFDAVIEQGNIDLGTGQNVETIDTTRTRTQGFITLEAGTYTFGYTAESNLVYVLLRYDINGNFIMGETWKYTNTKFTVTQTNKVRMMFRYVNNSTITPNDISNVMLVKGSTAPDHYIPYQQGVGEQRVDGYYVPLTISQQGQTDKTVDIYIGDSPLTEGKTVSKTSTGVDIELFEGENTISTTLYNKPEMTIKYKY